MSVMMPFNAYAGGDSGGVLIDRVHIESGKLFIWSSTFANLDSCATSAVIVIPETTLKFESFVSIALTAQATGKKGIIPLRQVKRCGIQYV